MKTRSGFAWTMSQTTFAKLMQMAQWSAMHSIKTSLLCASSARISICLRCVRKCSGGRFSRQTRRFRHRATTSCALSITSCHSSSVMSSAGSSEWEMNSGPPVWAYSARAARLWGSSRNSDIFQKFSMGSFGPKLESAGEFSMVSGGGGRQGRTRPTLF